MTKTTFIGLLFLVVLFTQSLKGQQIGPQTINVAAGFSQATEFSLSYSIGEQSSISYYRLPTGTSLSAGFLQDFGFLERDNLAMDFSLNTTSFDAIPAVYFSSVGSFSVKTTSTTTAKKPPLYTNLMGTGFDNSYFEIKDNTLFWSSADPVPGKETFLIFTHVLDPKGNSIEKFFEITRNRIELTSLEISNSFSPNGDGINDTWGIPHMRFFKGVRIFIFDKDGKPLFYTENPDIRWDGTFNKKELAIGTYFWIIQVKETGELRRGMLNLIRK